MCREPVFLGQTLGLFKTMNHYRCSGHALAVQNNGSLYLPSTDNGTVQNNGALYLSSTDNGTLQNNGSLYLPNTDNGTLQNNGSLYLSSTDNGTLQNNGSLYLPNTDNWNLQNNESFYLFYNGLYRLKIYGTNIHGYIMGKKNNQSHIPAFSKVKFLGYHSN